MKNLEPCGIRTGETHELSSRFNQASGSLTVSMNHSQNVVWHTDVVEKLHESFRAPRCVRRGLHHNSVASHQRGEYLPRKIRNGCVVGDDERCNAEGNSLHPRLAKRNCTGQYFAQRETSMSSQHVAHLNCATDFSLGICQRLAGFLANEFCQRVDVVLERSGSTPNQATPRLDRRHPP